MTDSTGIVFVSPLFALFLTVPVYTLITSVWILTLKQKLLIRQRGIWWVVLPHISSSLVFAFFIARLAWTLQYSDGVCHIFPLFVYVFPHLLIGTVLVRAQLLLDMLRSKDGDDKRKARKRSSFLWWIGMLVALLMWFSANVDPNRCILEPHDFHVIMVYSLVYVVICGVYLWRLRSLDTKDSLSIHYELFGSMFAWILFVVPYSFGSLFADPTAMWPFVMIFMAWLTLHSLSIMMPLALVYAEPCKKRRKNNTLMDVSFEQCLSSLDGREFLRRHLITEFSSENIDFVTAYENACLDNDFTSVVSTFIDEDGSNSLNLPAEVRKVAMSGDKDDVAKALENVKMTMKLDSYPRFKRTAIYREMLQAL